MKYFKVAIALMVITLFSTSLLAQQSFVRGAVIDLPAEEVGGVGNIISGVDFDGDGKLEIYAVNDNWGDAPFEVIPRIYKYENNGGTWDSVWSATLADPIAQNTWPTLAWDDLDADGKNEIYWGPINNFVAGNEDPARVVVFEAVGDGSDNMGVTDGGSGWLPNATWNLDLAPSTNMRPFRWFIEDIDNDGTKEIITSDRAPFYHIGVFSVDNIPDNGDGSETWTLEYSGPMGTPSVVRKGTIDVPAVNGGVEDGGFGSIVTDVDIDGDGRIDLFACNDNWGDGPIEVVPRLYKYEWTGSYWEPVWSTELNIPAQNTWPELSYTDLDNDGKGEITWGPVNNFVTGNEDPDRVVVYETVGDGSDIMGIDAGGGMYTPNAGWNLDVPASTNMRIFNWEILDIDADGTDEIVFADRIDYYGWGVFSVDDVPDNGDGSETWTMEASGTNLGTSSTWADIAVLNQIIYVFDWNDNVTVIDYDGGNYTNLANQAIDIWPFRSAQTVDIDSNGTSEIIAADYQSASNGRVYLFTIDADTLVPHVIGNLSGFGAGRLTGGEIGDIDGDGNQEFVFGERGSDKIYALSYAGTGDITDSLNYTGWIVDEGVRNDPGTGQMDEIELVDLNDDGVSEVFYTGPPRSSTTTPSPITILEYTDGTIGGGAKYDLSIVDNVVYLFADNGNVYPVKYENDRWQVLPVLTGVVPSLGSWKSASVADIDNDGTKEIIIGEWSGSQKVRLLQPMNGGLKSTVVVDLSGEPLPPRLNGGAMGDIDGDGFMDFVFGTRNSNGGIYRVEYTGGDIDDPLNYASSRIDEAASAGANQTDVVTIANVDADPELEVIYSGTPRSPATEPIPIVILDISLVVTTDIADVRVDADGDFQPDNDGQEFTISAVLTTANYQANSADWGVYVQDATGGIFIFANNDDSSDYAVGDLLQITGTVDFYNGLTELVVSNSGDNIIKLGTGTVPEPVELTIPEFWATGEMYESQLIKIKYVALSDGTWPDSGGSSTNLTFTDGFNEFPFRIDSDMDLQLNPEPTYPVNLQGVLGQFDSSDPYDSGYQILGTFYADIEQGVAAPASPFFSLLSPADGAEVSITDSSQSWEIVWESSVDLNGDPLIYQWVPIGGTPILTGNGGADTTLTLDAETVLGLMGAADTLVVTWTVATASGTPLVIVSSQDTFTVTFTNDIPVGVNDNIIPKVFYVDQNYPNPFNPVTVIQFGLPAEASVDLRVYDILGQQVAVIFNNQLLKAGSYKHQFNGSRLASGTYIYRLQSNDNVVIKKMMLVK